MAIISRPTADPSPVFHVKSVAIIGGGPAGLAAAKYFLARKSSFSRVVIFEARETIGGVWNHDAIASPAPPIPQTDPLYRHPGPPAVSGGPMYDSLHANITKPMMSYSDTTFPPDEVLFPEREAVRAYLGRYALELRPIIRLGWSVVETRLRPGREGEPSGQDRWDIVARSAGGAEDRETFDAVVVANGHSATPSVPDIPGAHEFHATHPGVVTHAINYRRPAEFAGRKVVIVGNGPSGLDIGRQISLAGVARGPVLLSVRTPTDPDQLKHTGCVEMPQIAEFLRPADLAGRGGAIRFADGRVEADVDAVIFCTGYLYSFPFLPDLEARLLGPFRGRGVIELYYHLIHVSHPTLAFLGLPSRVTPLSLCEAQAALVAAAWSNAVVLPGRAEMARWSERLAEKKKADRVPLHRLEPGGDVRYINELHDWVGSSSDVGKEPPLWGAWRWWVRRVQPEAKRRFESGGCTAKTFEELGLHYDEEEDQEP